MFAVLTVGSGTTVEQNSTVEIAIESFKDALSELAVFMFKAFLPAPFKFIPVVVDNSVKGSFFGAMPSKD